MYTCTRSNFRVHVKPTHSDLSNAGLSRKAVGLVYWRIETLRTTVIQSCQLWWIHAGRVPFSPLQLEKKNCLNIALLRAKDQSIFRIIVSFFVIFYVIFPKVNSTNDNTTIFFFQKFDNENVKILQHLISKFAFCNSLLIVNKSDVKKNVRFKPRRSTYTMYSTHLA